jgi:hypothetical protein
MPAPKVVSAACCASLTTANPLMFIHSQDLRSGALNCRLTCGSMVLPVLFCFSFFARRAKNGKQKGGKFTLRTMF